MTKPETLIFPSQNLSSNIRCDLSTHISTHISRQFQQYLEPSPNGIVYRRIVDTQGNETITGSDGSKITWFNEGPAPKQPIEVPFFVK